jgi:hypothetical protein
MKIPGLLAASLFFALPAAHAAKAHVHGEGKLDVAIDKEKITLNLELPLDAAVGFERPPKNDKEKAALVAADKALQNAAALFVPTPAANCTVQSAAVKVPNLGGGAKHDHAHEGEEHHADIDANYVFRCANPAAVKGIETTIFKNFNRLYRLEVQRAGPAGQGAARLTPNKPVLAW